MANDYELFEFLEDDSVADDVERRTRRTRIREQCDPFLLDETEFIKRYRLTKALATNLCEELRPLLSIPTKSSDLSVETKVLTALSFYATGSYQRPIGDISGHSMAQQTVSTALAQITACLNNAALRRKYIKFPNNPEERNSVKSEFYRKFRIPGVLGCIDCTHVAIIRPILHEERFFCRKHYHSLNVQLICDANMQITSVDASYGGATHDSFIWANHPINAHLENLTEENSWLLGDSGYPLRRTMMTPVVNAVPDTPEAYYTDMHVRSRNIIERTIGLLKARFRCLLAHRVLHYSPQMAGSIVNACVILHNICNRANTPVEELRPDEVQQEAQMQVFAESVVEQNHPHGNNLALQQGWAMRRGLIVQLWERRHLAS